MNHFLKAIYLWFDSSLEDTKSTNPRNVNLIRCLPHFAIYAGCFGVFWTGVSAAAIYTCLVAYSVRVFALTGFYHRLFSHRAFQTSRPVQFIFAAIGTCAVQRGPLWWASHHRSHHKYSDKIDDKHSPVHHGFFRSHFVWFLEDANFATDETYIKDLLRYPELRFLNRFDSLFPIIFAALLYYFGGLQILVWGFFISTVLVYQVTFFVNSIAHLSGKARYDTGDNSKNNWWLAILTFGEGWHNNHHHWPKSAKQGFQIYEIDITYYILKLFQALGLIWDLHVPPQEAIAATSTKGSDSKRTLIDPCIPDS